MPSLQQVTILGATGTIGVNTLDVISQHPQRFGVFALTANQNVDALFNQCQKFNPRYAVMLQEQSAERLSVKLKQAGSDTEVLNGLSALEFVSAHESVDAVMAAIVGSAGLKPSIAAAKAGKRILLANKETLVMAGSIFMQAVEEGGATLLPIDSEHNAIFQVMPHEKRASLNDGGVKKILLTASGGPFRKSSAEELKRVTVKQALNHPNWVMGPKITIDSATLMNKGLEVIEAHWLFNASAEQIEVVVHPQSVIHSMVEYVDGSVLAQLGNPDMRTPIAYGLAWPERIDAGVAPLNLTQLTGLSFTEPKLTQFPCLSLAFAAAKAGGTAPAVLNAANEVAVAAFLDEGLPYLNIPNVVEYCLNTLPPVAADSLETILDVDARARQTANQFIHAIHK